MKKSFVLFFLIVIFGKLTGQDLYKYEFGVAVRDSVITHSVIIDTGYVAEGSTYTIPPFDFNDNYPIIQFLYNAFAGSTFLFDDLTDENVLFSIRLVFNKKNGLAPSYFNENLFFVMIVDVFKMPGRIPITGDYFFKPGSYFGYILPKSQRLLAVFQLLNLSKDDLGFAYIRNDRFDPVNIETTNTQMDVRFRARHFSKFGGGRGHISGTTDVNKEENSPVKFFLAQNYPNPFNPTTKIKYSIHVGNANITSPPFVTLRVYDLLGREIATLVNERKSPGIYEVTFDANDLPSGTYIYKLTAGKFIDTKKMLLIK